MSRLIEIIRSVVQQELARHRTSLLGVVTAVFPYASENDDSNYEASVRLKHEDLELRQVAIAADYIGMVAPPRVGDLVLVQFINGDLNQPVITGRFYHDRDRPSLYREDEILFEHRVAANDSFNHLRFAQDGTIYLQRDVQDLENNSDAAASIALQSSGTIEIKVGQDSTIVLSRDGIEVTCRQMTINGDLVVSNGMDSTTISGTEIRGAST